MRLLLWQIIKEWYNYLFYYRVVHEVHWGLRYSKFTEIIFPKLISQENLIFSHTNFEVCFFSLKNILNITIWLYQNTLIVVLLVKSFEMLLTTRTRGFSKNWIVHFTARYENGLLHIRDPTLSASTTLIVEHFKCSKTCKKNFCSNFERYFSSAVEHRLRYMTLSNQNAHRRSFIN